MNLFFARFVNLVNHLRWRREVAKGNLAHRPGMKLSVYFCRMGIFMAGLFATILSRAEPLQYNRDIRPILSDRCFKCHGPDAESRKAKLRLDQEESAFGPRKDPSEHAIVPGKPEQSILARRINATDPG